MLKEYSHLQRQDASSNKRWFSDDDFDLTLYQDEENNIIKFELSYDKGRGEHSIIWKQSDSYSHYSVDDGESVSGKIKMTPILVANGAFDWEIVANRFINASEKIDKDIADFVCVKIRGYCVE